MEEDASPAGARPDHGRFDALREWHECTEVLRVFSPSYRERPVLERGAEEAGRQVQRLLLGKNAPPEDTMLRESFSVDQYRRYFAFLVSRGIRTARAVQEEFEGCAQTLEGEAGSSYPYLRRLQTEHPLLAATSLHLLQESCADSSRLRRKLGEWFAEVLEESEKASQTVDAFFDAWRKAAPRNGGSLAQPFLRDFQADMQDFVAASVHLACCFGTHAQAENCAVLTMSTPFTVEEQEREQVRARMKQILSHAVYQKYGKNLLPTGMEKNIVRVPTFISVADVADFLRFFRSLSPWREVGNPRL